MRDEEGGKKSENGESDYVQMIIYKEVKRSGVGDLIYRNERKEIKAYLLFTKSLP